MADIKESEMDNLNKLVRQAHKIISGRVTEFSRRAGTLEGVDEIYIEFGEVIKEELIARNESIKDLRNQRILISRLNEKLGPARNSLIGTVLISLEQIEEAKLQLELIKKERATTVAAYEALRKKIADSGQDLSSLLESRENLTGKISELADVIEKQITSQLGSQGIKELDDIQPRKKELTSELSGLTRQLTREEAKAVKFKKLNDELDALGGAPDPEIRAKLSEEVASRQAELQEIEKSIKNLSELRPRKKEITSEISRLKKDLKEEEGNAAQFEKLKSALDELEKKINPDIISKLSEEINKRQMELGEVEHSIARHSKKRDLKSEITSLERDLKLKNKESDEIKKKLSEQIASRQSELEEIGQSIAAHSKKRNLKSEISRLKKDLKKEESDEIKKKLNEELASLQSELEQIEQLRSLSELRPRKKELTSEIASLKRDLKKEESDEIKKKLSEQIASRQSELEEIEQLGSLSELRPRKKEITSEIARLKKDLKAEEGKAAQFEKLRSEIDALGGAPDPEVKAKLSEQIASRQAELQEVEQSIALHPRKREITSELASLKRDLKKEEDKEKLSSAISALGEPPDPETIKKLSEEIASREASLKSIEHFEEGIKSTVEELESMKEALEKVDDGIEDFSGLDTLGRKIKDEDDIITVKRIKLFNKYLGAISDVAAVLDKVVKSFQSFINDIRNIQQQLGVTGGEAVAGYFENFFNSIRTTVSAFFTGASARVSRQQILASQSAFRQEFGGVLSSRDATELAQRGVELGVSPQDLIRSQRTFMTQTMGDDSRARSSEEEFLNKFAEYNMTSRDAMEFIARNSELMARSGLRFQDSMIAAAAESKKIGVELSKVNQVGDNIIGNFEGFLDSMAELGAMGFGFDTFRLAQIAESGNTAELFNELRSQLAMTGKDLTDLRRSEQLALSSAFSMSMEDFQRMAGITPELAEDREEKEFRRKALNSFESLIKITDTGAKTVFWLRSIFLQIAALRFNEFKSKLARLVGGAGALGTGGKVLGAGAGMAGVGIGTGMAYNAAQEQSIGKIIGGILLSTASGAGAGAIIGNAPGALIGAGIGLTSGIIGAATGYNADDMVSRPGYGERKLITQNQVIALNNEDNIVAYADDMIAKNAGVELLSKGAIVNEANNASPTVNVDMSSLERKLDQLITALNTMEVNMDGIKVGQVLSASEGRAQIDAVFRAQRI